MSGVQATTPSSLEEPFSILQVLPQDDFSPLLIKSHPSKLLTCIPHEVCIEDTSLSLNPALELFHFNRIPGPKLENEA